MTDLAKCSYWWLGMVVVLLIAAFLPLWASFLLGFVYGFITATKGFYGFPFMYRWRR